MALVSPMRLRLTPDPRHDATPGGGDTARPSPLHSPSPSPYGSSFSAPAGPTRRQRLRVADDSSSQARLLGPPRRWRGRPERLSPLRPRDSGTSPSPAELADIGRRQYKVGRRYFFRGIEDRGGCYPRHSHYDCVLDPAAAAVAAPNGAGGDDDNGGGGSAPMRCDFVDTLMSAFDPVVSVKTGGKGPSSGGGSDSAGTVRIAAEDLSRLLVDALPFTVSDARPMFTLARDILAKLIAGKLAVASREAEALRGDLAALSQQRDAATAQLEEARAGLGAKLRRLEGRLERARKEAAAAEEGRVRAVR